MYVTGDDLGRSSLGSFKTTDMKNIWFKTYVYSSIDFSMKIYI